LLAECSLMFVSVLFLLFFSCSHRYLIVGFRVGERVLVSRISSSSVWQTRRGLYLPRWDVSFSRECQSDFAIPLFLCAYA
jgi:hypothetical protein